ncbi:hypothetical protein [Nocardia sp. NPDC057353]|uniref:hypothetical protein n=1 Tax=Nocardia sp. NPDC057353 TaxID=3346104 RepID=UPI003641AA8A
MAALSSGTAFRLLRIGALIVACLVFLWGCEVSRSATLGDVPEYLVLAGLAAVGGLVAGWFEIRAVRAARRTVTMADGRWRVLARIAPDGALEFVGYDEEPKDSDDPEDAPSGWVWSFPAESAHAVRGVLAAACLPDADADELDLLDLLVEAAAVLDPVAQADPGAWLHGHGVPGERHEWGVDPTRTTRTLPIITAPLARPVRGGGAKRRTAAGEVARNSGETRRSGGKSAEGRGSGGRPTETQGSGGRPTETQGSGGRPTRTRGSGGGSADAIEAAPRRGRARPGDGGAGSAEAATERTGPRDGRGGGAAAERGARRTAADRPGARRQQRETPGPVDRPRPVERPQSHDDSQGQQYSGPIRRRGMGRQQRPDPESWWETADGPTDRTYREPPPPRLSNPRRRRDE